jgi:putative ABC transport system permease protein
LSAARSSSGDERRGRWIPDRYHELRRLVRGRSLDDEREEELRFHLEQLEADFRTTGMSPNEAKAAAAHRFGDAHRYREETRREDELMERRRARRERLSNAAREFGLAARGLLRAPAFTIAAVATLALGIGANTAIFSVVNAVLLRPIAAPALDRLLVIRESLPDLALMDVELAPPEVMDLAERTDAFSAVSGYRVGARTLTGFGEATRVTAAATLGDFASVFGVRPHVGRFYAASESLDGQHRVAVLGYGLWQQLSGGDPSFVGRLIHLNGLPFEVIGVLPPDFGYPRQVQIWLPLAYTESVQEQRGSLYMMTVARMRPDVTQEQATAIMEAEVARWNAEYHQGAQFGKVLHSVPFIEYEAGPLRPVLLVLLGAVFFVLLVAAANVASLQLVRGIARTREMAVRSALGGGRLQLARQLLLENLLLGLAGGLAGIALGAALLRIFSRWEPAQAMHLGDVALDGSVLVFAISLSILAAIVVGLVPAIRAARVEPQVLLRDSTRGASPGMRRHRLLFTGVVAQVALALMLLLGSGLMIRTLSNLLRTDPGFDPRDVVTASVSIPGTVYDTPERALGFFEAVYERVAAIPGIADAALVTGLPFTDDTDSSPFDIPSRPRQPGEPERHAEARVVGSNYFRTMRIPLLRGRDFDGTERPGEGMQVIIDQTFAEQFFPGEDPVGREIMGYTGQLTTIIGVVGRVDSRQLADAPKAVGYYSFRQIPWAGTRSLALRTELPVATVASMVRGAIAELDADVPLYDVQTMEQRLQATLGPRRLAMVALIGFAALATLLAALGVYGVMRYTTNQRTREIGIRIAIGAEPAAVVGMVLRRGLAMTVAGVSVGFLASLLLARVLASIIFGVTPRDPLTFAAGVGVIVAVALLASWLPARRATRVDPVTALRTD